MEPAPALRAELVKLMLTLIDERPRYASVRERVPPALRERIEQSTRYEWLEIAALAPIYTDLWTELGKREYLDFFTNHARRAADGALLSAFVANLAAMFTDSTWGMFKNLPRAFELAARNTGAKQSARLGRRKAELVIEALPRPLRQPWFAFSLVPTVEFAARLAGHEGAATLDDSELRGGRMIVTLRWSILSAEERSPEDSYVDGCIDDSVTDGATEELVDELGPPR